MAFYEHTFIGKQDLSDKEVEKLITKYSELINKTGKILKTEKWGLLNFKRKIKNYTKGHFLHFKIKGDQKTLAEIKLKTKLDGNIVRFLTVKYKNLDLKTAYFSKNKSQ